MRKHNFFYYLCLLLAFSIPANAADVYSVKKIGERLEAFKSVTSLEGKSEIAFKVVSSVPKKESFSVFYSFNDSSSELFKGSIGENQVFSFPGEEKFIELDKIGTHNFIFKFEASVEKIISINIEKAKGRSSTNLLKKLKLNDGELLSVEYSPIIEKINQLASYNANNTRGSGTKIYSKYSGSVPLIVNGQGIGSGSIIDSSGLIVTNWHVISGAEEVKVVFKPEKFQKVSTSEHFIADVVKINKKLDLALLKLRNPPDGLRLIELGTIDDVEVAMDVHAIGHPKGNLWTYTKGVVSQIRPDFSWSTGDKINHKADVIQTQTPINPGNSGGPLLSDTGKMIGVNSFIDKNSTGLNFAVAITSVRKFFKQQENLKTPSTKRTTKIHGKRIDRDKDGYRELTVFDENNNGVIDKYGFDMDRDGIIEEIWIDKDENRIMEAYIFFREYKGRKIAIWRIDEDQDKKIDFVGYDFDLDGKFDKIEKA